MSSDRGGPVAVPEPIGDGSADPLAAWIEAMEVGDAGVVHDLMAASEAWGGAVSSGASSATSGGASHSVAPPELAAAPDPLAAWIKAIEVGDSGAVHDLTGTSEVQGGAISGGFSGSVSLGAAPPEPTAAPELDDFLPDWSDGGRRLGSRARLDGEGGSRDFGRRIGHRGQIGGGDGARRCGLWDSRSNPGTTSCRKKNCCHKEGRMPKNQPRPHVRRLLKAKARRTQWRIGNRRRGCRAQKIILLASSSGTTSCRKKNSRHEEGRMREDRPNSDGHPPKPPKIALSSPLGLLLLPPRRVPLRVGGPRRHRHPRLPPLDPFRHLLRLVPRLVPRLLDLRPRRLELRRLRCNLLHGGRRPRDDKLNKRYGRGARDGTAPRDRPVAAADRELPDGQRVLPSSPRIRDGRRRRRRELRLRVDALGEWNDDAGAPALSPRIDWPVHLRVGDVPSPERAGALPETVRDSRLGDGVRGIRGVVDGADRRGEGLSAVQGKEGPQVGRSGVSEEGWQCRGVAASGAGASPGGPGSTGRMRQKSRDSPRVSLADFQGTRVAFQYERV
ncbi:hypothetical protein ACHAWF_010038 [Thalassiosira exigua]